MNFRDIKYIHEKGNPDLQTAGSCYGCVLSNDEAFLTCDNVCVRYVIRLILYQPDRVPIAIGMTAGMVKLIVFL